MIYIYNDIKINNYIYKYTCVCVELKSNRYMYNKQTSNLYCPGALPRNISPRRN